VDGLNSNLRRIGEIQFCGGDGEFGSCGGRLRRSAMN
jgi:hypothetical protein